MPKPIVGRACLALAVLATIASADLDRDARAQAIEEAPAAPAEQSAHAPYEEIRAQLIQGGFVIGRTAPDANIVIVTQRSDRNGDVSDARVEFNADGEGYFLIGFDHSARGSQSAQITAGDLSREVTWTIQTREYTSVSVHGATLGTETETLSPAREIALKDEALRVVSDRTGYRSSTWQTPIANALTSQAWGLRRAIYNNEGRLVSNRPHYGVDIRAAVGSPVSAPADGAIVLSRNNFRYDGNVLFIEHGQGLVSAYLHLNERRADLDEAVMQGAGIARSGRTGRVTGPHLCWRLRWRDTASLNPQCFLEGGCV